MARWENIDVLEDPRLRLKVLQVANTVYGSRHLAPPLELDSWWHYPSLAYQVQDGDATEPDIVILNLCEGQQDFPDMDTHFMCNLNSLRIHDKFKDERFPAPDDTVEILHELREHAVTHARVAKQQRDAAREWQLQREKREQQVRKTQIKAYHERLVEDELLEDAADAECEAICPICVDDIDSEGTTLLACVGCGILCCPKKGCAGHDVDEMEWCQDHLTRRYCRRCYENERKPTLTQCSECYSWSCQTDLKQCVGRPLPVVPLPSKGTSASHATEAAKATRPQHPPKFEPCRACSADSKSPWLRCGNWPCWSAGGVVCNACSPKGGRACNRGHKWVCDECMTCWFVWVCPRCETPFCDKCEGIQRCISCGVSTICSNCAKDVSEDPDAKLDRDTPMPPKSFNWECAGCGGNLCVDCEVEKCGYGCDNCSANVCDECHSRDGCTG